ARLMLGRYNADGGPLKPVRWAPAGIRHCALNHFFDICVAHQPAPCLVQAQQSYAPRLFARLALTPDATPPTIFANRLLSNCLVRACRRNRHEEEIPPSAAKTPE